MTRSIARVLTLLLIALWCAPALASDITCPKQGSCQGNVNLSANEFTVSIAACTAPFAEAQLRRGGAGASPVFHCPVTGTPGEFKCAPPAAERALGGTKVVLSAVCTVGGRSDVSAPIARAAAPGPAAGAAPPAGAPAAGAAQPVAGATEGGLGEKELDESDPKSAALATLREAIWQEALREVGVPIAGARLGNYYNRVEDVAVLFFDADGDAYFPVPDIIDEDDRVYVVVVDTASRLKGAQLGSSGCKRPPVEPRVYSASPSARQVAKDGPDAVKFAIRALGTCAGAAEGGPKLTFTRDGKSQVQQIPINELYQLAVGVALAYDNTWQRDYALNTLPGETIARVAEVRDRIGLSSLTYISYYPIPRDFRKKDFFLAQRAQLFIGLDPRALDKHLVAGVGYELTTGLNALFGWRFVTKQKVLEEGSGLVNGTPYDDTLSKLPTRERWETGFPGGFFLGVGLSSSLLQRLK